MLRQFEFRHKSESPVCVKVLPLHLRPFFFSLSLKHTCTYRRMRYLLSIPCQKLTQHRKAVVLYSANLCCVLSHTRTNERLRTNIRITKTHIWLHKCLVLPVVNGQRPVSPAFSCDTRRDTGPQKLSRPAGGRKGQDHSDSYR